MGTLGHNVMLWGEPDAYAVWMVAATSDRLKVADFFASTRQDLDADNGFVSPEDSPPTSSSSAWATLCWCPPRPLTWSSTRYNHDTTPHTTPHTSHDTHDTAHDTRHARHARHRTRRTTHSRCACNARTGRDHLQVCVESHGGPESGDRHQQRPAHLPPQQEGRKVPFQGSLLLLFHSSPHVEVLQ